MTIGDIRLFKYTIPLISPYTLKGKVIDSREGFLIQIVATSGHEGWGESAPLPGYSTISLNETKKQIELLKRLIIETEIDFNGYERLDGSFTKWFDKYKIDSCVRFGIETAVLNLIASIKNIPLYKLLSKDAFHESIMISGLLSGSKEQVTLQAESLLEEGYSSFKLKVGGNLEEDISKVQAVNDIIQGKGLLHVDANQNWSVEQATSFANAVGCAAVEYIEEPFKDIEKIAKFFEETYIPAAFDETLQTYKFEEVKSIEGVDFLILKPTLIGGIEKTWKLIQRAKELALETVISSSFESEIGILALANLSARTFRDRPAGIDTLKWFEYSILNKPLLIDKGHLHIKDRMVYSDDINFELIEEIF